MNFIRNLFTLFIVIIFVTSCSKEDEPYKNWQDSELCHKLIGTSWQLYSFVAYCNDGSEYFRSDGLRPQIHTFTNVPATSNNSFILEVYDSDRNITEKINGL